MSEPDHRARPVAQGTAQETVHLSDLRAPLRAFFRRRVDRPDEVDDLVQELMCRLIEREKVASTRFSNAYVFQAAANLLRDRARRRRTQGQAHTDLAYRDENQFEEISAERVLIGREMVARVLSALDALPERTRAVFLLHRYEGMKYREIADRFGVSESSIEKHMIAAIRHLTKMIGPDR